MNNINPSKNHITFDRGNKASFVLKRINTGHFLTKPIKEWIPFDQRGRPIKMAVKAFSTAHYYNCPEPPSEVKRVCDIEISQVQGRNVFTLRPKGVKGARHIFYLHGGAYMQNFLVFHWWFLAKLARKGRCIITAPDYPLAPRHTYKDTIAMVSILYRQLIRALDPADLVIMGDSAGGGLALSLAQKMKAEQVQSPGQLILLSPWLDITLANPAILEIETKDPILNKERLRRAGLIYARNARLDDHLLSPINGPLDGMGTISVFAGSDEIFVADTRRLQLLASLKEIKFNYYEYSGYSILADEDLHRFFQLFTRPSGWQKKGAG